MKTGYYDSGPDRAARVRKLFGRIASRYDLVNDLQSFGLHRWWKRRVVRMAAVGAGHQALDVCCGTGDLARLMAMRGATVAGLDFSSEMLAVAQARKPAAGPPIAFTQGDAQALPFNNATFDAVTMGYGLRNLSDWRRGLREMARVARPGGRVVVLDFGKPPNAIWRGIYFGYLRLFVPVLGKVFCGDSAAYAYILESLRHYPAQDGVRDEMLRVGLKDVRVVLILGGVMSINYGVA